MRVAVISSRFPCANNEPFLGTELAMLRPLVDRLIVAPLRPSGTPARDMGGAEALLLEPIVARTAALTCKTFARAPRQTLQALLDVLRGSGGLRVLAKNLAIFPRALALAQRLHAEGIEHVHAYWLSTPSTAALVIARVNGVSWSSTAHRWDIFEGNMVPEKAASATFIRAISERGRRELVRRAPSHAEKMVVVRLGTALAHVAPMAPRAARTEFRLLCAAAFRPVKGHAVLLEAFAAAQARCPALHLTLCGQGPLESAVRSRVRSMPCPESVTLRGYVNHAELLRELAAGHYDAVVLASIDDGVALMEGVPSILIEASSLGVSCIATRSGAIAELLDDANAFLAEPGSVTSLERAILAAESAADRSERAARAATRARTLHDPYRRAADLVTLFGASA